MPWKVRRSDVEYFMAELCKDSRSYPEKKHPDEFVKDCFSEYLAQAEASVLSILGERLGTGAVPAAKRVEGSILVLERVRGARLFDLIRHLRHAEQENPKATAVRVMLIQRAVDRLRLIQLELARLQPICSRGPYPLKEKLTSLLELFLRVFDITKAPIGWQHTIEEFVNYWEAECVSIPFRDATTKNMIVADERLALEYERDAESTQRLAVIELLDREPLEFWKAVPLIDLDFSSIVHSTSIEDDPISLLCHEWTSQALPYSAHAFVLDPELGTPNAERAAATLFVRYLRFGGRKLAYRLINSHGFNVRFAYDNPHFYFGALRQRCQELSPKFVVRYEKLLKIVDLILQAALSPTRSDQELLEVDHLRRYGHERKLYWQQSPEESQT